MKVFIVTSGSYDTYDIDGIFSSKKKAEEWIKKIKPENDDTYGYGYRVERCYELDNPDSEQYVEISL